MNRGEVWWADLGEPRGSGPASRRPVLVVSSDRYNTSAISTVIVAVLTTGARPAQAPDNVSVEPGLSGLTERSVVNVSALITVDRGDLEYPVGRLETVALRKVDAGLRAALDL